MVKIFNAQGIHRVSRDYPNDKAVPIFLDDSHRVIEAPSLWILSIARKASRSRATLRKYSAILYRYFRWLDDNGFSAQSWGTIDEDIFELYIEAICTPDVKRETIVDYCARIYSFHKWASRKGYDNYFEIDLAEIESVVEVNLKNQLILANVKPTISVTKLNFDTPAGRTALHEMEVEKFVTDRNQRVALHLMDDMVYRIIATIIRITGLRPRDLFQIPYRGKGDNSGFVPYDFDEIPEELDGRNIHFSFRSKGKDRSIEFPGLLWRVICEEYIPLRRERAKTYYKNRGISPSNDQLFLSEDGDVVNDYMLRYNFAKVVKKSMALRLQGLNLSFTGRKYTPRMLRHSCATYFVLEHLKRSNRLGKPYQYDPTVDEALRRLLGHADIEITYKYYVHLVNRFHHDDLLADIKRSHVNEGLSTLLEEGGY
jgi:site-specific recombinase XerD